MAKPIYKFVFLFLVFLSTAAHSITVENFDAFQKSDNLAMRDVETGLVWLDFGVNNGESINSVVSNLNGIYAGWRLPTESEVVSFWERLAIADLTGIFDLCGANKTPSDNLPYLAWGYFVDEEGYLGAAYIKEEPNPLRQTLNVNSTANRIIAGIEKKIIDVKYDGSDYYLFNLDGAAEISTLLVKKTEVNEPSLLMLVFLIAFVFIRRISFH